MSTPARNYPYIPLTSFIHGQALGPQALSYKPLAGGGKAGQVAAYLDAIDPPALQRRWKPSITCWIT